MTKKIIALIFGLVLILASSACQRSGVGEPSPTGPSTLANVLKVSADPNVIFAESFRQSTNITVTLKKFDGTPLSNKTVYFEIYNENGGRSSIGYLENNERVLYRTTDGSGNIHLLYYGPLASEFTWSSRSVYIWATVAMAGSEFISDFARVDIIRDP